MTKEILTNFFCEAALATYAGNATKGTILELPGSKVYTYERYDLLYKDVYYSNGLKSGGQTTIFSREDDRWVPIWLMHYSGQETTEYKNVIPFLKTALKSAYSERKFYGGRGPSFFTDQNGMGYFNTVNWDSGIARFDGSEYIACLGLILFVHIYSGRALIDLE